MKKISILVLLFAFGFQSFSQKSQDKTYFLLSDSVFTVGSYCVLPDIIFNLSGGWSLHYSSYGYLDSILVF